MADPYLCTTAQVKAAVGISHSDDDAKIASLISAVTETIKERYHREFIPQADETARTFPIYKDNTSLIIDLDPYDLRSVDSVVIHPEDEDYSETLTANDDYILWPVGGRRNTSTYTAIRLNDDVDLNSDLFDEFGIAQITITGDWGIWDDAANVSSDVNRAAIETVLSWLDRPTAIITGYNDAEGSNRSVSPIGGGYDIPFAAHRKLSAYKRTLGVF